MAARAQPKRSMSTAYSYAQWHAQYQIPLGDAGKRAVPWLSCTRASQAPDHIAMERLMREHIQRRSRAAAAAAAAAAASRRGAAARGRRIARSGGGARRVGEKRPRSAAITCAALARGCRAGAGCRVGVGAEHRGGKVAAAGEQHHPGPRRAPQRLQRGGERARRARRGRRGQQRPPHGKVPPVCASRRAGQTSRLAQRQHDGAGGSHAPGPGRPIAG